MKDIDDLLSTAARLQKIMNEEQFLVMVTHFALPDVIEYAEKKNVAVIYTYEF
ncbi:hypothetical protein HZA55_02195 [Candidatus Poribacteria bacterium]|nr:hypothetical protein [Candidatus Poribacteria bacterium]